MIEVLDLGVASYLTDCTVHYQRVKYSTHLSGLEPRVSEFFETMDNYLVPAFNSTISQP